MWARLCRLLITLALRRMPGLQLGNRVVVSGRPIIDIRPGASIIIGDDCELNSINRGYHVSMFAPVKLFADIPGALITIGEKTRLHGSCLHAYNRIEVGRRCLIAANCQIMDCSGHDLGFNDVQNRIYTKGTSKPVIIEDDVWIGANSIILPGVRIGHGSIVGAGSVVTKEIPPMVVAGGNPARLLKLARHLLGDFSGVDRHISQMRVQL